MSRTFYVHTPDVVAADASGLAQKHYFNESFGWAGGLSFNSAAGVVVNDQIAMQHSTVWACVRVLSESVGQLPLLLKKREGENWVLEEDTQLSEVITVKPNAFQTIQEFVEFIVVCLCLRGNFFAHVNRTTSGKIVEIIPIHPDVVQVELKDFAPVYSVRDSQGHLLTLSSDEVLHIKGIGTSGWLGLSPIEQCSSEIGLAIAAQKHGEKFFSNSAKPNGFLTTDETLSDEQFQQLSQSWKVAHQGVENANKIALLHSGMKFQQVSISNRDSQFLETRAFEKQQIAQIFRVPLHRLQDYEGAKYSNVENQELSFYNSTIAPYLKRIEQALNLFLPKGYKVDFDDRSQLRGDSKTRAEVYSKYISMGVMSPDEVRVAEGMNPRPDNLGHMYVTQTNNLTFGENSTQEDGDNPTTDSTEDET